MARRLDLSGQQFGKLTALAMVDIDKNGNGLWECICSCGERRVVRAAYLNTQRTTSCGCARATPWKPKMSTGKRPVKQYRQPAEKVAARPWLRLQSRDRAIVQAKIDDFLDYAQTRKALIVGG